MQIEDRIQCNADYFLRVGGERANRELISSMTAIKLIMYQNSYKKHKGNQEMINLDWKIYIDNVLDKCQEHLDNILENMQ